MKRGPAPDVIICADWSKHPARRAAYAASTAARVVERCTPTPCTVPTLFEAADRRRAGGTALVGFDAPLGVPRSYLATLRDRGLTDASSFIEWLASAPRLRDWFLPVARPRDWSVSRPFFRVQPGPGGRTRFERAAAREGIGLRRLVDQRTGAKPVFVLGVPGQVGPAAQALWQELVEARASGRAFSVWPFEGSLERLLSRPGVVLAEIYPRVAYAIACDVSRPVAKTQLAARRTALDRLRHAGWLVRHGVRLRHLEAADASEDDFDACVTAAALLRLVLEKRPLATPALVDAVAEGGILGV